MRGGCTFDGIGHAPARAPRSVERSPRDHAVPGSLPATAFRRGHAQRQPIALPPGVIPALNRRQHIREAAEGCNLQVSSCCLLICMMVASLLFAQPIGPNGVPVPPPQKTLQRASPQSTTRKVTRGKADGYDWREFHLDMVARQPHAGDGISMDAGSGISPLGPPGTIVVIPRDMRHPLFGTIKLGTSASQTVIPVAVEDVVDQPRVYMQDGVSKQWRVLFQTKSEGPTQMCPLYDSSGQTNVDHQHKLRF